jgi:transcriptional regulator with XRE-family HTH domain
MKNRLSIIDVLETARVAQGVTQADLAYRAGTSRVTVGRIEAGFDPKLSTVYELARSLGLELTLVPKSLAGEVQAFLRSGGRSLA